MPDESTHFYPYGRAEDSVMSIRRRYIQEILAKKIKTVGNINAFYNTSVRNVNLKDTTFDVVNADGSIENKKYTQVFGTDGAYSAVQKAYLQTLDFNYSIDFGDYGYMELEIPQADDGGYRHEKEAFHFWPRNTVMMAGLPNIENNFTIGLFMKYTGENSFEYFEGKHDEFEKYIHSVFKNCKYLMPRIKEDHINNPMARIAIIKTYPWKKGNFLLMGDSAHAMTPFYGQGLNSGLEDCTILEDLLIKHNGHWPTITDEF